MKNSNTTNSNGWRWISSWASNSKFDISIDFAFWLIIFLLFLKSNKNTISVRKTRAFQQTVMNTMHLMIFCYSQKDIDWSINSMKWKTTFSYGLSSLTIRKWEEFVKTPSQQLLKLLFACMLLSCYKHISEWTSFS